MKDIKISAFQISCHEFYNSIRDLKGHIEPIEIVRMLIKEKQAVLKGYGTGLMAMFVISNIVLNFKNEDLDHVLSRYLFIIGFDDYVLMLIVSFIFIFVWNYLISFFIINQCFSKVCSFYFRGRNFSSIESLFSGSSAIQIALQPNYSFIKDTKLRKISAIFHLSLMLIPSLFIVYHIFLAYFHIAKGIEFEFDSNMFVFIFISISLNYPIISSIFLFKKSKIEKNIMYVRWGFLYRIYLKYNYISTDIKKWIN